VKILEEVIFISLLALQFIVILSDIRTVNLCIYDSSKFG